MTLNSSDEGKHNIAILNHYQAQYFTKCLNQLFFSSREPKAQGELIVRDSSRASVRACVRPHFQT